MITDNQLWDIARKIASLLRHLELHPTWTTRVHDILNAKREEIFELFQSLYPIDDQGELYTILPSEPLIKQIMQVLIVRLIGYDQDLISQVEDVLIVQLVRIYLDQLRKEKLA